MFIPCDHCLRKHGSHAVFTRENGREERLQLCDECFRRHRERSSFSPPLPKPPLNELEIASQLRAALLPRQVPQVPGYDVSAFFRPSPQVGGDYYDFFRIDEGHLGLLVAAVSGRGVPASIIMTETKALVMSEAVGAISPSKALCRVNRVLYQDIKRGMFITLFYAILDPRASTLTCASAGHNPMVLWRKASDACQQINPIGIALGFDKGPLFDRTIQEQSVDLSKGDRFALYTDGIVESMNRKNEPFGKQRFYRRMKELANSPSSDFLSKLIADVDAHQGDAPQRNDLTILTGRAL
jgi:sigma-B regulation protein RsbU (phosphoserine phosphatase)